MQEVLGIVCDNLVPASNHRTAEMVKSVENMYRHVGIVIAIELAKAYPDLNILEVCRLVGTKWNIPTYFPSIGTGGCCIPLSSKYVLQGTQHPEHLEILNDVIESDTSQPYLVADVIAKRIGNGKAGILGLSYKGDLKVHILSPTLRLVGGLKRHSIDVAVHDPYYTVAEIQEIAGTGTFNYPQGLRNFDCIVIVPEHRAYSQTPKPVLFSNLRPGQLIIDNVGVWERFRDDFKKNGIDYRRIGDAGWLRT
jgi:UDP-N-acetyl-D-mannosaminuronate dehydrogenase